MKIKYKNVYLEFITTATAIFSLVFAWEFKQDEPIWAIIAFFVFISSLIIKRRNVIKDS